MKKTAYILGSVELILGTLLCCIISIIRNVLPVLGRIAYQAAAAGSYSPSNFRASFGGATVLAVLLMLAGAGQILWAFAGRCKET